jgi:phosphonate transport system substrate-binding protein
MGATDGFFSQVVCAGWHQRAIRWVAEGQIDGAAIDSQVLAIECRDHPELTASIRVIDTFGPSTIQPVVARTDLPDSLKTDVQAAFSALADDPAARAVLSRGLFDRFIPVSDADYEDIRLMLDAAEATDYWIIR